MLYNDTTLFYTATLRTKQKNTSTLPRNLAPWKELFHGISHKTVKTDGGLNLGFSMEGLVKRVPMTASPHVRESGIRNPANFCCWKTGIRNPQWFWNPESRRLESGIQRVGIQNLEAGIRNPGPSWILLHGANSSIGFVALKFPEIKRDKLYVQVRTNHVISNFFRYWDN